MATTTRKPSRASAAASLDKIVQRLEQWQWRNSVHDTADDAGHAKSRLLRLVRDLERKDGT